ncbi:MAG: response regulator [Treponema sp.]|nr:response regulator [Treponema sp.]MCL2272708.1 response regulator [Treponema sp.]
MKTIFVVDDNTVNLMTADKVLSDWYNTLTFVSASAMFEFLNNIVPHETSLTVPDLILLDIMMPDIDGFKALKMLRADARYTKIPVIFLTSKNDANTEALGFQMGVIDFISKPFSGLVLLNRIKTHLHIEEIITERTAIISEQAEILRQRTEKLLRLQNSMVSVLSGMVENRDKLTGEHILRTTEYLKILINSMAERGVYAEELKNWDFDAAISSSRMHDLGKITVTDLILNKPGKLTDVEFNIVKTHAAEGEKIIDEIIKESGEGIFLQNAKLFAGYHHERWDGQGYPRGLTGLVIPLQGRIMAVADVYDALVSVRPYKEAFTHEKAVEIILNNKGKHFDPEIVDVFKEINILFIKVK